jgi:predicted transcriptional regulator
MYTTNLSWNPLKEVLSSLVKQEFLREIEVPGVKRSRRRYEVAEKGGNVLTNFEGASEILDIAKVVI